ncbi:MAG: DUF177 domain-containing protein [Chlorobiaceae bacterium]
MHKENALIEIPLAGLMQGTHRQTFTCKGSDFKGRELTAAGFNGTIDVQVAVKKSDTEVDIAIETSSLAELTCDLCLTPVSRVLNGSFRIYYLFSAPHNEERESDEEYRILERNALSIDITEDVRETVLLSLPMKVTCPDYPECRLRTEERESEGSQGGAASQWLDSLEKLKYKYR